MQTATEGALSDIFYAGIDEPNTKFKNASHYFAEDVRTEMAARGSLDDMFEHNLER